MKVLLINGSPHRNGSTARVLEEAAATLLECGIETETFWVGAKPLAGCIGCGTCATKGKCVFDDTVNEFVEKAQYADGFIFGTPVHYAAMSGALKSFMDRTFYSSSCAHKAKYFRFKPAASVIVARRGGTTATYDEINKYFGISQMPIISTRYWNMVHGVSAQDVEQDEEGMQSVRMLAKNMAYYLKCIEAGKNNGILPPEQEKTVFTNFVRK